jgi:hypothetical protein
MKSDFVSTVSHEFRSPLASITQLGEMLRDGIVGDEGRRQEYYGMIVTESQRLRGSWRTCSISPGWRTAEAVPLRSRGFRRVAARDRRRFQAQVAPRGFAVETDIPRICPHRRGPGESWPRQ